MKVRETFSRVAYPSRDTIMVFVVKQTHPFTGTTKCAYNWPDGDEPSEPRAASSPGRESRGSEGSRRASDTEEGPMEKINISYGGETITMEWDGAQASAPILVDGESTPYQTASARHRTDVAVVLACRYAWPEETWPEIPGVGSIPDDWSEGSDAWDAVAYETMGE